MIGIRCFTPLTFVTVLFGRLNSTLRSVLYQQRAPFLEHMPKNLEMVQLNKDLPFRGNTTGTSPEDRRDSTIAGFGGNIMTLFIGLGKRKTDGSAGHPIAID